MTLQSADTLIYKDTTYYIRAEILSSYLEKVELPYPLVAPNTACWRGYAASYVVQNDKLFLTGWRGWIRDFMQVGMEYLFPGESFVFADWFSGEIVLKDLGEVIGDNGYCEIYEGRLMLQFENGILIREYEFWNSPEEIKKIREETIEGSKYPF
jgi:hypothetical protein